MQLKLEDLRLLGHGLSSLSDERPDWLKALQPDPSVLLHRFLYELARQIRPTVSWEIGTCAGAGAAHLAMGYPQGTVFTVDIDENAKRQMESLFLPNVRAIHGDSLEIPARQRWMPRIDLLFIDGEHRIEQVCREYATYLPFMNNGGLILFDDLDLNPEMKQVWTAIPEPKIRLDSLHFSGFGAALVRS